MSYWRFSWHCPYNTDKYSSTTLVYDCSILNNEGCIYDPLSLNNGGYV